MTCSPGLASERIKGLWRMWLNPLLKSNTCSLQSRELGRREPLRVPERRQALDADGPGFERRLCCLPTAGVSLGNCVMSLGLVFLRAW